MSQDGALFRWEYVDVSRQNGDSGVLNDRISLARWSIVKKHYFMQNNVKMKCAAYHPASNLLVAGFSNGIFGLYELPDFNMIHTLR